MQPAVSTKEATTYIVEGSREAASSSNSSGYKNISHCLSVAWCKVLERREQVEEASEAEKLSIRIIIGEGSCATAPRGISGSWKHLISLFSTHSLGEQRARFLACMYQHKVACILHYEAATKSIPSQLALCHHTNATTFDARFWCFRPLNS